MGRQPGQDQENEEWDLASDEMLKELSPLRETLQRGLFQRIVRQRAVYFADVEDAQNGGEDEEEINGTYGNQQSSNDKDGGQREDHLPPSAFADLSTWCCDAFLPARSNPALLAERSARFTALVDQPTMILSLLAPSLIHIADLPTQPNLVAMSTPTSYNDLARNAFSVAASKLREALAQFCRRFLRACRLRHARKQRPAVSRGHELLMERLRERQERGVSALLPIPPGERRPQQVRLPADRLLS